MRALRATARGSGALGAVVSVRRGSTHDVPVVRGGTASGVWVVRCLDRMGNAVRLGMRHRSP